LFDVLVYYKTKSWLEGFAIEYGGDGMSVTRFASVLLMFLLVPALLFGAITATYYAEPSLYLQVQPGPYTSDTVIGAKLGYLEVTTDGEEIYSPAWGSTSENFLSAYLHGPMRLIPGGPLGQWPYEFHIMSVAYPEGYPGPPIIITKVDYPYSPIIKNEPEQVKVSPFRVELYLVNTNSVNRNIKVKPPELPASCFEPNESYTLTAFMGARFDLHYSFVVANQKGTKVNEMMNWWDGEPNSSGSYVSVGGNTGSNSIAVTSGLDPGNPEVPYGDPSTMVNFSVFLSEQSTTFDLSEAVGTNRKDVNTMTITVSNGIAGADYSQKVIFTDLTPVSTSAEFRMLPEESGPNPIPFKLYFDSMEVVKGEAITWSSLQNGSSNTKTIRIGGIDQNIIDSLASGTYSDTINVEIRNP